MTERSGALLRGSVRATVGVLVVGVAATAATLLTTTTLPIVNREPVAVAVDALHGAEQTIVCPGSFAELGADASRSDVAVPTGSATIVESGDISPDGELQRAEAGGSAPQVLRAAAGESAAAAQSQLVTTATLDGLAAASCVESVNEQWIVGGSTALGASTTLSISNPAEVPATVQVTVYTQDGEVDQRSTTGVLVPARSERTISLNGYAPGNEQLAVRVVSTGAAVSASLGIGHVVTLTPHAVDTVTRQLAPATMLVIPGVTNISHQEEGGPGDAGELDRFPVVVRILAPGGESGTASIRALLADGSSADLGQVDFSGSAVVDLPIPHWPDGANAVAIDATAPLIAGVQGTSFDGTRHDYAWFAPAPMITPEAELAAPIVEGGELVLANLGTADAIVTISDGDSDGEPREVTVPAGAAMPVPISGGVTLSSTEPVAAGVRVSGEGLAGYPLLTPVDRVGQLTVYPR